MHTGSQITRWMKRGLVFAAVWLACLILAKPVEVRAETSIIFRNDTQEHILTDDNTNISTAKVILPSENGETLYYQLFHYSVVPEADADLKIKLDGNTYKIDVLHDISLSTNNVSPIYIVIKVENAEGCKNVVIDLNGHKIEAENSDEASTMFLETTMECCSAFCTITGNGELNLINSYSSDESGRTTEGLRISGVKLFIETGNLKIDVRQKNSSAVRLSDSNNGGFLLENSAGMNLQSTGEGGKILTKEKELSYFIVHGEYKGEEINTTNPYIVSVFNSLNITPESPTIQRGKSLDFTANLGGWNIDSTAAPITWELEGASNPDTTLSENGQLSVSSDESADTLTVKATATYDGITKTDTTTVEVQTAPSDSNSGSSSTTTNVNPLSWNYEANQSGSLCLIEHQGPLCVAAFNAATPQGYMEAFSFNLLLKENGLLKPSYAKKSDKFVLNIPKEWQKPGRKFILIGIDKFGNTKVFYDTDLSDETFTTLLDMEGHAFSVIYTDTDADINSGNSVGSGIYTVKKGDTLSAISKKLGKSKKSLIEKNQLDNPDILKINQKIEY